MKLLDKVAVVTGGGGPGCGSAVAQRLAREGVRVVIGDIDEAAGRSVAQRIADEKGTAIFVRADIGNEADVVALLDAASQTFGGLDVLVSCASAPYRPGEPLEHWPRTLAVDLLGAMQATRLAIDAMRARGGGAIVHFGSTSALWHGEHDARSPAYDVAKAGVIRLVTALASLRQSMGIRVNGLVPHWIATPEVKAYWDTLTPEKRREEMVPDVLLTVEQIADAVVDLVTDDATAGRLLVLWGGEPRRFIARGDRGYAAIEVADVG